MAMALHLLCAPPSGTSIRRLGWNSNSVSLVCSRSRKMGIGCCTSSVAAEIDRRYMRECVELARQALGKTSPNPMVGCVVVKDGQVVGRGFHPKAGEPHAEVFALREAGAKAEGATAYVSLEPCNHFGRTPPCSQALVRAKVKRVVVGTVDPNPLVAGKGVETLRKAGIQVVVGVENELCKVTNEAFFHRILTKKPFTCLRYHMSIDGCFLDEAATCKPQRGTFYSQQLNEYDAVVVTQTAVASNPIILSSEPGAKQPLRVVFATSLAMDPNSHIFDTALAPTLVVIDDTSLVQDVQSESGPIGSTLRRKNVDVVALHEPTLDSVLELCYERGACSVLLDSREAGNVLAMQALGEDIVQKVCVVVAPIMLGNSQDKKLEHNMMRLGKLDSKKCGENVILEGYLDA